jgi:hypothetical protein
MSIHRSNEHAVVFDSANALRLLRLCWWRKTAIERMCAFGFFAAGFDQVKVDRADKPRARFRACFLHCAE